MRGQQIAGYEVLRELGRGGMGVVLAVRCPRTGRELALKLQQALGAEELVRFRREAEALARVRHPGVVPVHAFDVGPKGEPLLVTELVPGVDLKAAAREALPPRRAAALVRDLARAAAAIHAQGVVHRDLKPSNVIVRPDGRPVIIDFGVARVLDAASLTATGMVLGTPGFLAPEQAAGARVDARTDVYGLGAILFFLLARRAPFEGTALQVLTDVLQRDPRWPSADDRSVPRELEAVCRRAMARDPRDRPQTASALADALEAWLDADRRAARRGGRTVAALLALLAVAALAAAAATLVRRPWTRTTDPAPVPSADPPRSARAAAPAAADPPRPRAEAGASLEARLGSRQRVARLPPPPGASDPPARVRFVGPRELIVLRLGQPDVLVWRLAEPSPRAYVALPPPGASAVCILERSVLLAAGRETFVAGLPGDGPSTLDRWVKAPGERRESEVVDLATSADAQLVLVGRRGTVELHRADGGVLLSTSPADEIRRVAFAGPYPLVGTSRAGDLRARTGQGPSGQLLVLQESGANPLELGVGVSGLAGLVTDVGLEAVVATEDGSVRRFDLRGLRSSSPPTRTYALLEGGGELAALAVDPLRERLYTATRYSVARVRAWRLADEAPRWAEEFDPLRVNDLAVSADGKLLAIGFTDGSVEVWSTAD